MKADIWRIRLSLVLGRMLTGWLSLIASSILIFKILARYRAQRTSSAIPNNNTSVTTYHRIMLGMSALDVLFSMASAVGPLAVPADTDGATFAHGTTATCTAQGAFSLLLGSVVLYTAALNTFFMLKIRYNVADAVMTKRYEPWLHAVPLVFAIASSTTGIGLQIYNALPHPDLGCWIATYPAGCEFQVPQNCTRGQRIVANPTSLTWYNWVFSFSWMLAAVVVVVVNSILIYTAIRRQERRNQRYNVVGVEAATTRKASWRFLFQRPQPNKPLAIGSSTVFSQPSSGSTPMLDETENASCLFELAEGDRVDRMVTVPSPPRTEGVSVLDTKSSHPKNVKDVEPVIPTTTSVPTTPSPSQSPSPPLPTAVSTATRGAFRNPFGNGSSDLMASSRSVHSATAAAAAARQKTKQSRLAAQQSMLYCCATLLPGLVMFLLWLAIQAQGSDQTLLAFTYLVQYLVATQGIFNLCVYVRPPYKRLRESQTIWSRWKCLGICLFSCDPKYW